MARYVSDLSQDFIVNKSDRPDGMRGPSVGHLWGDVDIEPSPVGFSRGYVERDLEVNPMGSLEGDASEDFTKDFPVIPREHWCDLIEERERNKETLTDLYMTGNNGNPIEAYDQNGQGYCWAYSVMLAITLMRAKMGQRYIRLSGHSLACRVKNYRDEGGWCGLSMTEAIKYGYCTVDDWAEKSMSRSNSTDEAWERAKNFAPTEGFIDMQQPVWGKTLTFDQLVTLALSGIPGAVDFNFWSHSIGYLDPVAASDKYPIDDDRAWGLRIGNSWRKTWGRLGTGVILGKKAVPNGAVAIRNVPWYEG